VAYLDPAESAAIIRNRRSAFNFISLASCSTTTRTFWGGLKYYQILEFGPINEGLRFAPVSVDRYR